MTEGKRGGPDDCGHSTAPMAIGRIAGKLVDAFVKRAEQVYGAR